MTDSRPRDLRVDFLRGLALLVVYSDHIAGNIVREYSLMSFGYSDMAEMFVFLSGFVCGPVYERTRLARGCGGLLAKAGNRCLEIYLANLGMLLLVWGCFVTFPEAFGTTRVPARFARLDISAETLLPFYLLQVQLMQFLVLTLYLVLLAMLPVLLILRARWRWSLLAVSLALYLAVQWFPGSIHLPGHWQQAWYFNPWAWQLVFFLGAELGLMNQKTRTESSTGELSTSAPPWRRLPWWLIVTAAAGLELALLLKLDWPGLVPSSWTDKADLGFVRVLHFGCLMVIIQAVLPRSQNWLTRYPARALVVCGQQSLVTYCAGGLLAIGAEALRASLGTGWSWQILVNIGGWLASFGVACVWGEIKAGLSRRT